eukprot:scaffold55250_cov34-Tisochrysis_lutea.AAC.5
MARLPFPSCPASLDPHESRTGCSGRRRAVALLCGVRSGTRSRVWQPPHATGAALSCVRSAKRMAWNVESERVAAATATCGTPSSALTAWSAAASSACAPSPREKKEQLAASAAAVWRSVRTSWVGGSSSARKRTAT